MINELYEIPATSFGFFVDFLNVISFFSIMSAILIVIAKNPIVSVLYLIFLFSNISVYLIFIGLPFIGLAYLLVYVGAVSILFLFILMLINIRVSELTDDTNNNIPLAIFVILAFFIPISNILPHPENKSNSFLLESLVNKENIKYVSSSNWEGNLVDVSDISAVGNVMYTSYFILLIIASLILLLAMVGSIVITVNDSPESSGLLFQDNAITQIKGLEELLNSTFDLKIILFVLSLTMSSVLYSALCRNS